MQMWPLLFSTRPPPRHPLAADLGASVVSPPKARRPLEDPSLKAQWAICPRLPTGVCQSTLAAGRRVVSETHCGCSHSNPLKQPSKVRQPDTPIHAAGIKVALVGGHEMRKGGDKGARWAPKPASSAPDAPASHRPPDAAGQLLPPCCSRTPTHPIPALRHLARETARLDREGQTKA